MSSSDVILTRALLSWFGAYASSPILNLLVFLSSEMAECLMRSFLRLTASAVRIGE